MNDNTAATPSIFYSRFSRFQTRSRRRTISVFYLITLIALLVETWFVDSYYPVIPLFALTAITTIFLYGSTRGIAGEDSRHLDEHQIRARNSAFRASYMIGVFVALAGGYTLSEISGWDTAFEVGLWLSLFGFVGTLPTLVVAWKLPSELSDED